MWDWIASVGGLSILGLAVVLAAVFALDTVPVVGIFVPADVAVFAAVAARGPQDAPAVVLAVLVGSLAGWTGTFAVGRFVAEPLRRSWPGRRIGDARWASAERLLTSGGARMLLVTPFLPVVNTIVPVIAGSLRMPYRRFICYAVFGSAIWGGSYAALGLGAQCLGAAISGPAGDRLTTLLLGLPSLGVGWTMLARLRRRLAPATASVPADSEEGAGIVQPPRSTANSGHGWVARSSGTRSASWSERYCRGGAPVVVRPPRCGARAFGDHPTIEAPPYTTAHLAQSRSRLEGRWDHRQVRRSILLSRVGVERSAVLAITGLNAMKRRAVGLALHAGQGRVRPPAIGDDGCGGVRQVRRRGPGDELAPAAPSGLGGRARRVTILAADKDSTLIAANTGQPIETRYD
jgi:membrane protein DedA with SNARE-associated domain